VPEFTIEDFSAATGVSRETLTRLKAYADLLVDCNAHHNLVAKSTLPDLWRRHFWDSAQLAPLIPKSARTLADLGSGAGFPGLVLAALRPDLTVTLHEATAKKCAFLRTAAERMSLGVIVINGRIEELPRKPHDVITARALAPLPRLLGYAWPLTGLNSVCLFLKGQNLGSELTEAHKYWNIEASQISSASDPSGAILAVRRLAPNDPHLTSGTQKAPRLGSRQPEGRRR
jgi:16S rRNA (guanine527-N7)-methyltransferase